MEKTMVSGGQRMQMNIRIAMNDFLNMTSEKRIEYINKYHCLLPYEQVALLQCRKYMTRAERKAYKEIKGSSQTCENQPQ